MARMWMKLASLTAYRLDRAAYNLRLGYRDGDGREYTDPWVHPTTGEVIYEIETADPVIADLTPVRQLLLKDRSVYETAGFFPTPAPTPNNPTGLIGETVKVASVLQRHGKKIAAGAAAAAAAAAGYFLS